MRKIGLTPAEYQAVHLVVASGGDWKHAAQLMNYSEGSVSNLYQSACRRLGISPRALRERCLSGKLLLNEEMAGRLTVRAAMLQEQLKAQACASACKPKGRR